MGIARRAGPPRLMSQRESDSMPANPLRRLLLGIGHRLPSILQRPFHRFLYDGPPPDSGRLLVVAASDEPDRPVRFEFVGGCRDGEVYEGPLANPFFWKSEYGRIGVRFLVPTPAAVEAMLDGERTGPILDQEYEVVGNLLQDGIRHVRAEARKGGR